MWKGLAVFFKADFCRFSYVTTQTMNYRTCAENQNMLCYELQNMLKLEYSILNSKFFRPGPLFSGILNNYSRFFFFFCNFPDCIFYC